jgi:hypothetical protein
MLHPNCTVGADVGFGVVGVAVGFMVGALVGALVRHDFSTRASRADDIAVNAVLMNFMSFGMPYDRVSSVPWSTEEPTPTGMMRSTVNLSFFMALPRFAEVVRHLVAVEGFPSVRNTYTVAPPFSLSRKPRRRPKTL